MDAGQTRLGVDVGGTFTDVVLLADGAVTTAKVPTTEDQSKGVMTGIRQACDEAGIDPSDIDTFRHAMTVGTNVILEGNGAPTALVTTAGFGDILEIGRQNRPALYDLDARKPAPLVPAARRYELDERATTTQIESRVRAEEISALADQLDDQVESVAISFLHAYANPANEKRVAELLREATDLNVVASHEVLPEFREYERTATTVADAVITPVISEYLGRLVESAAAAAVPAPAIMQSNGGIAHVDTIRDQAVTTALSGPAAGVVGASLFENSSHEGIITFDMGGTSSDVSLVRDGTIERTTEGSVGEYPIHTPMVDIETIGAGGGSIAWIDEGGALRVGPRSAGAEPGPASYGNGGEEPTVTDASLLLGYLDAEAELGGDVDLDKDAARRVFEQLAAESELESAIDAARGTYRIATERMARAVRAVTVEQGHDPREFALVAFGGAGPMHAASLAESLGIETIRVPLANGVLSALGLLAAPERHDGSQTINRRLADAATAEIESEFESLTERLAAEVSDPDGVSFERRADLRYAGQSHELTVEVTEPFDESATIERFHDSHERKRGFRLEDEPVQLVTLRVTATIPGSSPTLHHDGQSSEPRETRQALFDGNIEEVPVYSREQMLVDTALEGPAIFESAESTIVVPPGWTATMDDRGTLRLETGGEDVVQGGEAA